MHNLPVLEILAGDRLEIPTGIFRGREHVHAGRLHARPHHVHVPALAAQALVHDPLGLLRDAVLVLAPDAGVAAEATTAPEMFITKRNYGGEWEMKQYIL